MDKKQKPDFEKLLDDAIVTQNERLIGLEPGTKEYDSAVDAVAKLMNLKNETKKTKVSNWSQFVKVASEVGLGIASLLVLIWGTKATFRFEETGTITSSVGRKIQDKLMSIFTIFKR